MAEDETQVRKGRAVPMSPKLLEQHQAKMVEFRDRGPTPAEVTAREEVERMRRGDTTPVAE